jgi:four helix bundle protein
MKDESISKDLKQRTKKFALRIIKLYTALPKTTEAQVIGKQVLRSGTSIGAHYAESQRGKSNADFINKLQTALQELEETIYWLEIIIEANIFPENRIKPLIEETNELIAIFTAIVIKVKQKDKK